MYMYMYMYIKDAERMTNSVDPDQTAPVQSDQGLHCSLRHLCHRIKNFYQMLV